MSPGHSARLIALLAATLGAAAACDAALPSLPSRPVALPRVAPASRAVLAPWQARRMAPEAERELAALSGWQAAIDAGTGRPARLFVPAAPAGDDLASFAREFLSTHPGITGIPAGGDVAFTPRPPVRAAGKSWVVVDESYRGYPVEGGRGDLRFADGKLLLVTLRLASPGDLAQVAPVPGISSEDALAAAEAAVRASDRSLLATAWLATPPLAVVRGPAGYRLAWKTEVDVGNPRGRLSLAVDALTGEAISSREEWPSVGTAVTTLGSHEPREVGQTEVVDPYPFLAGQGSASSFVSDGFGVANAQVPAGGADYAMALSGPLSAVYLFGSTSARATLHLDPGVSATFLWSATNATISERDAYRNHQTVHARMVAMAPDLTWLQSQLGIFVDIVDPNGCNAYWDGVRVNFYKENATCNSTARVADVVYHETGHGLHQHLSVGGYIELDIGEGSADFLAATITGDPAIGPTFYKTTTAPLRNLSTLEVFPTDVTGEPHHDGVIWGGAWWDLRETLIAEEGSAAGVALVDKLEADTLRADPSLDDGFYDVLDSDAGGGSILDGTPHECEIARAFGRHGLSPGVGVTVEHLPLGMQDPAAPGYEVRARVAPSEPHCGGVLPAVTTLQWRPAGDTSWNDLPMENDLVPGWVHAVIPPQPDGSRVEYRLSAVDALGATWTDPRFNYDTTPFSFTVGRPTVLFGDDFEVDRGWTHLRLVGPDVPGADDWERGLPGGRCGDPLYAFSGTNLFGNSLGVGHDNGCAMPGVTNELVSPVIDATGRSGVRLTFRRWLSVQSTGDQATIVVNGTPVWESPATEVLRDEDWRFEDVDLSPWADGQHFQVGFETRSAPLSTRSGGWNVDDVFIVSTGTRPVACGCDLASRAAPGTALWLMPPAFLLWRRRARRL